MKSKLTTLLFLWNIAVFIINNLSELILVYWHKDGTTCHSHGITTIANHNHPIKSVPND